jgi:voltage-gated potassium channel
MSAVETVAHRLRRLLRLEGRSRGEKLVSRRYWLLGWITLGSLVASTTLFYVFEHGPNTQVEGLSDSLWWWIVTAATVGYGDMVPVTPGGRIATVLAILTGFFVFTHLVALIAESVHAFMERRERGTAQVRASDHIVVCEYTAVADEVIARFEQIPQFAGRDLVVVSDLVTQNPLPQHSFVQGVPFSPEALRKASIAAARYVFVFANLRFADPDLKSLHIAARVFAQNPRATIFVELLDPAIDLLAHCSGNIIPLASRSLIERVLRSQPIDPFALAAELPHQGPAPRSDASLPQLAEGASHP